MVNIKQSGIIIALLFVTNHLSAQSSATLQWIVGTWKINTGQGYVIEQWKQLNDSTFSGKSFFLKPDNDTIPQESIQLALRGGQWYYTPTVQGQNNNAPVSFKLQFIGRAEFIGVNPAHDFPQRLAYRRIKNQLFASIEGLKKGKYVKQNFDFTIE
jgi:hypothetical protein